MSEYHSPPLQAPHTRIDYVAKYNEENNEPLSKTPSTDNLLNVVQGCDFSVDLEHFTTALRGRTTVVEYDNDDGLFPTPIDSMSMKIVHRVTLEDSALRAPETLQILKDILGDLGSCEMVQTPVIAPTAISPSPSACWSSKRQMETYPEPGLIALYPPTKRRRLSESDDDIGSDLSSVGLSNPIAVCGILGSGEQTRIESCIIRIPESMVESQQCSPN
jgi:hypothetical protein